MDVKADDITRLREIRDDAIAWLKYAESKNGALAAIAAGSLYAAANLASKDIPAAGLVAWSSVFFLLALLCAVLSFLPITRPSFMSFLGGPRREKKDPNPYYFADVAGIDETELLAVMGIEPVKGENGAAKLPIAMANQAIVNSRIALRKLDFFEFGLWLYVSGLVTPVVAFLLFWVTGGVARIRR